MFVMFAVSNRN